MSCTGATLRAPGPALLSCPHLRVSPRATTCLCLGGNRSQLFPTPEFRISGGLRGTIWGDAASAPREGNGPGQDQPPLAWGRRMASPQALPWHTRAFIHRLPPLQAEGRCRTSTPASSRCWPSRQPSSPPTPPTRLWCAWSRTTGEFPAWSCHCPPTFAFPPALGASRSQIPGAAPPLELQRQLRRKLRVGEAVGAGRHCHRWVHWVNGIVRGRRGKSSGKALGGGGHCSSVALPPWDPWG